MLSGCNPQTSPGDLIVGSNASGVLSVKNTSRSFAALYGVETGHPDPDRSDPRKHTKNLLQALFVIPPEETAWIYAGGGSNARPWFYRLFYSARWMHYPIVFYTLPDQSGHFSENSEKREVTWEIDGRNRLIAIAGKKYPMTPGEFIVVKLDERWNPEVGIGEKSFDEMNIPAHTRNLISECMKTMNKGIHALKIGCSGPG